MISRRKFMSHSLVGAAFSLPLGLSGCSEGTTGATPPLNYDFTSGQALPWMNWAKNQGCVPARKVAPSTEDELLALLSQDTGGAIRPVGAGHSFSPIVPTDGTLLATDLLSGLIDINPDEQTAQVWSGTRLHQLGPALHAQGLALANLPDIAYQTVAGAISTSTHGSGVGFGSLSAMIREITLATPGGELLTCSATSNADIFHAARCGLGALGIITRVKIATVPAFYLKQKTTVEPLNDVMAGIAEEKTRNRHFELLAFPHTTMAMVVRTNELSKSEVASTQIDEDPTAIYQLRDAYRQLGTLPMVGDFAYRKIIDLMAEDATSVHSGPAHAVLTHDRVVPFREMEYTLPADAGPACLKEILDTISAQKIPVIFPIEYRYTRADDVWLSMFNQRDGCSISIHQFADEDHRAYFAAIEPILRRYGGRPHWGKLHTLGHAELAQVYPHWQDFLEIRQSLDPQGRMLNPHLAHIFGISGSQSG